MNVLLFPKHVKDLISEFNVEHRPLMRLVIDELDRYWNWRNEKAKDCDNCFNYADDQYSIYILWKKYNFCGEWCRHDLEDHIRKSYRNYIKCKTLRG
jgi:hypothetical protein